MKETGKMIAKLRDKQGLSRSDLANELKVRESVLKKWENGTKNPSLFQLKKLSNFFNVKISKLADDDILIKNIDKNHKRMWKMGIGLLLLIFFSIGISFMYCHFKAQLQEDIYVFKGQSDNFKFSDGIVVLSKNKRYISLSKFDCVDNLDVADLTINIAFNNEIWITSEYHEGKISFKEWINKLVIREYGQSNDKIDPFLKHNNKFFIDNMQVEINYCNHDDKCMTDVIDIEPVELKLNNRVIEDI